MIRDLLHKHINSGLRVTVVMVQVVTLIVLAITVTVNIVKGLPCVKQCNKKFLCIKLTHLISTLILNSQLQF